MYQRIVKVLADKGYLGDLGELMRHFFSAEGRQVEIEISQRAEKMKDFQVERSSMDCGANLDLARECANSESGL